MRSYLALCRFPAVFTALADIFLGFAITAGPVFRPRFALALLASAGLYLGGMVLNDLLDEARDAIERPSRPIPSGRVSKRGAWIFYASLTVVGVGAALCINLLAAAVAATLAIFVWLYDGPLKRTLLGPPAMGLCRSGNILLGGAAGVGTWMSIQDPRLLWMAAGMGLYIWGLTWFARQEAGTPKRTGLVAGWVLVCGGLAGVMVCAGLYRAESALPGTILPLVLLVLLVNYRMSTAIVAPSPESVQPAVRSMLLAIPIINASVVATVIGSSGSGWAIATGALLFPAAFLGRFLRLT